MSRLGKKPISVPSGVKVALDGASRAVTISGPQGSLSWTPPAEITIHHDAAAHEITVSRPSDQKRHKALHGMARSLLANMVAGVEKGYEKRLEIHGVGYSAKLQGQSLLLNLGYMGRGEGGAPAQFVVPIPEDLVVEVPNATNPGRVVIRGASKELVGKFASEVRKLRPPEPYKGKGVRFQDEQIRRKQGKAFAGGAT